MARKRSVKMSKGNPVIPINMAITDKELKSCAESIVVDLLSNYENSTIKKVGVSKDALVASLMEEQKFLDELKDKALEFALYGLRDAIDDFCFELDTLPKFRDVKKALDKQSEKEHEEYHNKYHNQRLMDQIKELRKLGYTVYKPATTPNKRKAKKG